MKPGQTVFTDFEQEAKELSTQNKLPCCIICLQRKDEAMISFCIGKLGYCKQCLQDMATGKIDASRFWRSDITIEKAIDILTNYSTDEKSNTGTGSTIG